MSEVQLTVDESKIEVVRGGWQSIETAPKDGTRIYVYGYWDERRGKKHTCIASWSTFMSYGVSGYQWMYEGSLGNISPEGICVTFTHWMPLPAPPNG